MRLTNTTEDGKPFDRTTINAIWEKATVVYGQDPKTYRKDICGFWIKNSAYGSKTDDGWVIDHIKPVEKGGTDDLDNLQPLHWKNNNKKADNYPVWYCASK